VWKEPKGDVDSPALRRVIWSDPADAGDVPVVAAQHPNAAKARCIAVGPHRGLNLANWCCRRGPSEQTVLPPADATGLVATLATERSVVSTGADFVVTVAIENRSTGPREINAFVAASPILLLEVRDAAGRRVPPIPPSMPPPQPEMLTLPPRGGRTFLHLMNVFSPPLRAGSYTLRVVDSAIASAELPFHVVDQSRTASSHR
jgi:hypothetical protein